MSIILKNLFYPNDGYTRYFLKIVINNTTIGTQTMVVHVIESAVTFLSIP